MIDNITNSTKKRAFKIKEAAEQLGLSESSVRRLIARGIIKPVRVLRHLLIPVQEIEKLLTTD